MSDLAAPSDGDVHHSNWHYALAAIYASAG